MVKGCFINKFSEIKSKLKGFSNLFFSLILFILHVFQVYPGLPPDSSKKKEFDAVKKAREGIIQAKGEMNGISRINRLKRAIGGAGDKGEKIKSFLALKWIWRFIKFILFIFIAPIRIIIYLPYYLMLNFGGGVSFPTLVPGVITPSATPLILPLPFNLAGLAGLILSLFLLFLYLFYFNPVTLVYKYGRGGGKGSFKDGGLLILGISIILSVIIQILYGSFTFTFFLFFAIILVYDFYSNHLDDKHKPIALWILGIILVLILLFGFFHKAFIETGRFDSMIQPILLKAGVQGSADSFSDIWNLIFHPEKAKNYGSIEDEELVKREIGISLKDLKSTSKTFNAKQPIGIRGTLEAASLHTSDSRVKFSCELRDYVNENININPEEVVLPGNAVKLVQTVSCIFEDGISPKVSLETKEAKLISSFEDFYTESKYTAFFLDSDRYDELYAMGKNPFNVYGWDQSLVSPGNFMNSIVTPGPVDLLIGSEMPQPFKEGDKDLYFEVMIDPDSQVKLNEIKEFKLYVPSDALSVDSTKDKFCKFRLSDEKENNFDVYEIKDIEALNNDLAEKKSRKLDDEILLGCFFNVNEFLNEGGWRQDQIKAEMIYSFDMTRKTSVSIRRSNV